jgi:hypothetical protein
VALLVAAGLYARLWGLGDYAFNPDEALQLSIAGADGVGSVLEIALAEVAHPPGFILLLHGLLQVDHGTLFLRGVSLVPGLASIALAWVLGRRALGRAAGLFMGFAATFGYASVELSQVLRPYAAVAALLLAALWCLVEWERTRRSPWLWGYGAALGAAALLHLSAVIPTAALGAVVGVRLLRSDGLGSATRAWLVVHALLGAVYLAVFVVVILPLMGSEFRADAVSVFLRTGYPGSGSLVPWIRNALLIGVYFTSPFAAWSAMLFLVLAAAGVVALWRCGHADLALAPIVAGALNALLALFELYPFSGSRHCSYLFPLLLLPAGCAVQAGAAWLGRRLPALAGERRAAPAGALVAAAACLLGVSHVRAHDGYRAEHRALEFPLTREVYARTLHGYETEVAPGDVVVSEDQTARYALWEGSIRDRVRLTPLVSRVPWRGHDLYYFDSPRMMFVSAAELLAFLDQLAEVAPLEPGTRVWFFSLGFRHSLLYTILGSPEDTVLPAGLDEREAARERLALRRLRAALRRSPERPLVTGDPQGGGVLYAYRWATLERIARQAR